MLALILLDQGRRSEAVPLVASACRTWNETRRVLAKVKLCD
jgi:hypothetical protein